MVLLAALLALLASACGKKPYQREPCNRPDLGGCVLEKVKVVGNDAVSDGDIEGKIATAETSHPVFGLFEHIPVLSVIDRLTVNYERLDPFVLERDLQRVERYYRARGYYEAHARAARTRKMPDQTVQVEIVVDEGQPVRIGKIDLKWKDWSLPNAANVAPAIQEALTGALKRGAIFDEDAFEAAKGRLLRVMTDRGFAYAKVDGKADVDLRTRQAHVVYTLELGPICTFGDVTLEGNGPLPARPLLAAIPVRKGRPFSTAALESAEAILADFGVFGSIESLPQLSPPGSERNPVVPIVIRVQQAALRSIKLGLGAEVGGRVEAHGVVGWENRNLFGGLRRFSIEARPGVAFYPKTFSTLFNSETISLIPELRIRADFRQPAIFLPLGEARTAGVVRGAFNHYRLPTSDPRDDVGYDEIAGTAGLERSFFNTRLYIGLFMNIQYDKPFSYLSDEPPAGYQKITIPFLQGVATVDLRRGVNGRLDKINPHSGLYFATDAQVAWGDAYDLRIRPEFRAYFPVSRRWTLAFRLATGFLFPVGAVPKYPTPGATPEACTAAVTPGSENPALATVCDRDRQLLQFRGFFSGGANSNRGYPYNGVGPRELARTSANTTGIEGLRYLGIGGLTLWESSLELRVPLTQKLGSAVFVDASDVRLGEGEIALTTPHLSAGFGLRYDTPVGPLRGDFGFRIPCAQAWGKCEGDPASIAAGNVLGLPLQIAIAIGEAF